MQFCEIKNQIEDKKIIKEDTLITIQVDFQLAQRFGMSYIDTDGQRRYPYVIHRTSVGCYERTLALLIEKYAGALPLWLMPEQVRVLPIGEKMYNYSQNIKESFENASIRVHFDGRNEKIGFKIRDAQLNKVPYNNRRKRAARRYSFS